MAALTTDQILDAISGMTVLEVSALVKAMEEKFGVTAAAPVAMVAAGGAAAAVVEEQTEFNVILKGGVPADKKISIIKEVRTITGLGLKEAKDLVEGAPKTVKEAVPKAEADTIKKKFEDVGAKVEIK